MGDRDIEMAVRKLAGVDLNDNLALVACTVVSVDLDSRTCDCTPISGDAVTDIPNVQLMAELDDGFLIVPSVNSTVFVLYSTRHVPYVALFSQIDQIIMITGNSQVIIKDGLIQFNDGSYGGLIQIAQLVTKLNNLENTVNDLIKKYDLHTHTGVQAGAGISAPPVPLELETLTPTQQEELENTTVTHGKLLT